MVLTAFRVNTVSPFALLRRIREFTSRRRDLRTLYTPRILLLPGLRVALREPSVSECNILLQIVNLTKGLLIRFIADIVKTEGRCWIAYVTSLS